MSILIGSGVVLSPTVTSLAGLLAFDNIVTAANVTATSETVVGPIANIANPGTGYLWGASSAATQTITINAAGQEVDYLGIARHNLNQAGLTIQVKFNGVEVLAPQSVSDTQAIMILLNTALPTTIEIIIAGATTAPRIAVLYAGKYLQLEREIQVGHTPITLGRDRTAINGVSENGQYLGEIVVRETNSTTVALNNLTPAWYRTHLDPFFSALPRKPCFFAWRSVKYPDEVGYCWIEGSPRPVNQRSNGMMEISWSMRGIA